MGGEREGYRRAVEGREYADVITKLFRLGDLPDFLSYGAPLARAEKFHNNQCKNVSSRIKNQLKCKKS